MLSVLMLCLLEMLETIKNELRPQKLGKTTMFYSTKTPNNSTIKIMCLHCNACHISSSVYFFDNNGYCKGYRNSGCRVNEGY